MRSKTARRAYVRVGVCNGQAGHMLNICDPDTAGAKYAWCSTRAIDNGGFHAYLACAAVEDQVMGAQIGTQI
jgi:hypothetical protein